MSARIRSIAMVALLGLALGGSEVWAGAEKKEVPQKIQKAQQALADELAKLKANGGQSVWMHTGSLSAAFPQDTFFAVRFRQFPVARILPEEFRPSNVFVVLDSGKVRKLADTAALQKFFRAHLAPAKNTESLQAAVACWLTLAQEFVQDGFYQFEVLTKEIEVAKGQQGIVKATGRAMVTRGGNGELRATLGFDENGQLKDAKEQSKIRPGPRPICQATKLLDGDPIVRRMAEQDLLIMGPAACGYLQEQRARANGELRQAIDRLWQRIQEAQ